MNETLIDKKQEKVSRNPLYKRIADTIRGEIRNNYSPNDPLPSQRELAQRFKTSYMTVNNAIQQLVQEGLVTRTVGAGTFICDTTKRSRGLVSIVMPDKSEQNPIYWSMLFGTIERELRSDGFRPIVFGGCDTDEEGEKAIAEIGRFNENGIILYGSFVDKYSNQLHTLQSRGIPIVTINHPHAGFDCSRVSHRMIGILQANYIIQKGYKRVLYLGLQIDSNQENMTNPFQGFVTTIMKNDSQLIPLQLALISEIESGDQAEMRIRYQMAEITKKVFSNPDQPRPDAIVVIGDCRIPTVVEVLRSLDIIPGRDVILVGADDQNLTGFPYTTIDEGLSEIGHKAVELLMDRIDGKYSGEPRIYDVTPKLVEHGINPVMES